MSAPLQLLVDRISSPVGTILLAWDEAEHLRALDFVEFEPRMNRLMARQYSPGTIALSAGTAPDALTQPLTAFFAGNLEAVDSIGVSTGGTEFQRRVWAELRRIPAGSTISYGELATRVGNPAASRAVGLANGSNPIAIVVPCHRVIGANGSLTGYGGGMERKRWLLGHEQKWSTLPLWRSA